VGSAVADLLFAEQNAVGRQFQLLFHITHVCGFQSMAKHHHHFHGAICVISSVPDLFLKDSVLRMFEDEGMQCVAQPLTFALYG
jgi:hypothetical protein